MSLETDENQKIEFVVRKFGLLEPVGWTEDCESEMRLMDDFWNKLVDVHEHYTSKYLTKIMEDQEFASAKVRYDDLALSEAPQSEIAASKKQLAIAQKEAGRRMAAELRALESARREEVNAARRNSGLWWGNYNAIVRSFESARSAAVRGGNKMRRRSAGGNGRITNTLQGGADVDAIFDGRLSQLFVCPPADGAWSAESRGERRRLQRTTLSATVFVRNGERRTVTWPMVMHRPIPPDCRVKKLTITRRRSGDRWKWAASFMCTRSTDTTCSLPAGTKVVGIDIGWRRVPEGLRVATIVADGEPPRFINLPKDLLDSFALIDELRARVRVITLKGLDLIQSADPQKYGHPFQALLRDYQSIADKKATHLKEFCRGAFFLEQPKEEIGTELLLWRNEYRKLLLWLGNQQNKVVLRRNHLYQNAAINMLEGASEIIVNDVKVGEIAARRPSVPNRSFFPNRANHYRVIAATSELVRAFKLQATKRGITFSKREAELPARCPECGSTSRKTRADALLQICASCNATFDQDVAAGRSLLSPTIPGHWNPKEVSGGRV